MVRPNGCSLLHPFLVLLVCLIIFRLIIVCRFNSQFSIIWSETKILKNGPSFDALIWSTDGSVNLTEIRQWALDSQSQVIDNEMHSYDFQESFSRDLNDLVMEKGGEPIRNVIFTTWRSGSSFLGEIVNSHPSIFYHFEPHLHYRSQLVPDGPQSSKAVEIMKNLLNCNFTKWYKIVKDDHWSSWVFSHNVRVWKYCKENHKLCWDQEFHRKMCVKFPFQLVKTVRMKLTLARPLLEDPQLNVRVLFLVRDPRGIIPSRLERPWCHNNPDCYDPSILCSNQVKDYLEAERLTTDFPDRFMIVRYEELCKDVINVTKRIFKFFRLSLKTIIDPKGSVRLFIDSHTVSQKGGPRSTYRNSNKTLFGWRQSYKNNFPMLIKIQKICGESLKFWGYNVVHTLEQLNNPYFNPVNNSMSI